MSGDTNSHHDTQPGLFMCPASQARHNKEITHSVLNTGSLEWLLLKLKAREILGSRFRYHTIRNMFGSKPQHMASLVNEGGYYCSRTSLPFSPCQKKKIKLGIAQSTWHSQLRRERLARALQSMKGEIKGELCKIPVPLKDSSSWTTTSLCAEVTLEEKGVLTSRTGTEGTTVGLCLISGVLLLLAGLNLSTRDLGAKRLLKCREHTLPRQPVLLHRSPLLLHLSVSVWRALYAKYLGLAPLPTLRLQR